MFGKLVWWALVVAFASVVEVITQYSQETSTPASFLQPRNFNYHPYQLQHHLQESKPTKQGPVLFPNDGQPPPRGPLIVTARPLLESIANSDRNPNPPNNTIPTQNPVPTQSIPLNPAFPLASPTDVTLSPDILENSSPLTNNDVFGNSGGVSINNIPEASSYNHVPYAEMLLKARLNAYGRDNRFNDYEEQTVTPPIYAALSDHARQNVLRHKPSNQFNYQTQNLDYGNQYDQNGVETDENDKDYDQDQNYAFSYRVKDQKTGDDFSHKQKSISGGANGEYRVRLPDGRLQIVSYTADENGYKAEVRYDDGDTQDKNDNIRNQLSDNQNVNNNDYATKNNNNLYQQYDDRGYSNVNNDYNNLRQYDNQNIYPANYFTPQNNNLEAIDRVLANNYAKHQNNVKQYDNSHLRNEYVNYKDSIPIKEDPDQYNSKEYYDYYSEYNNNQNYEPYNSKFAIFRPTSTALAITTVRPTYELRPIFTVAPTKGIIYTDGVISASNNPVVKYESTTDNVVKIGGKKVYTNVNQILPTEQTTVRNLAVVTPASYLASTIASLRDRMTPKPVGFGNFISKLTKYLSYK